MKKVCSLLLALVMAMTLIPFSSAKEDEEYKPKKRYTVLALDVAKEVNFTVNGEIIYTASSALSYVKEAALRFLEGLKASQDENCVSLLVYYETAYYSAFTDQLDEVGAQIDQLYELGYRRNIPKALDRAWDLLKAVPDEKAEKSIVLVTTGMTNDGYTGEGPYDETTPGSEWSDSVSHVYLYKYANGAINEADKIKNSGVTIYTVGIFQPMEGIPDTAKGVASLFRRTTEDIATSQETFFPVEDPEALQETFADVAHAIGGAKPEPAFLPGDVDGNGKVEAADARLALRRSVGLEDYAEGSVPYKACDVDFSGDVTAADARLILRASVGLEDPKTWIG